MFQTKSVKKLIIIIICSPKWDLAFPIEIKNKNFVFNNFFPENRAVYEIMWGNTVDRGRPQMAISACALHAG